MEVLELPSDKIVTTISSYVCMLYLQTGIVSVSTYGEHIHLNDPKLVWNCSLSLAKPRSYWPGFLKLKTRLLVSNNIMFPSDMLSSKRNIKFQSSQHQSTDQFHNRFILARWFA